MNHRLSYSAHRLLGISFGLGIAAVGCASEPESIGKGEAAAIGDVSSMQQRADGKFDVVCKDGSREVASQADVLANRVCERGVIGAVFGSTDTCSSGSRIAFIREATDCSTLGSSGPSWSIQVDGVCVNINDTSARAACEEVKRRRPTGFSIFGSSDTCSPGSLVQNVREATDCSTLSSSQAAWSISINGQCIDIRDTNVREACRELQRRIPTGYSIFGRSDSCSPDSLVQNIRDTTDCNTLSSSESSWSISIDGRCLDIGDTNVREACRELQRRIPTGYSIFGRSDSCSPDALVQNIRDTTDCNTLGTSQVAWSISINGECIDIHDTNVRGACVELKRRIP